MLLYESAFLTTLKQKDAVEITQMAKILSSWLASGPQLPARLPGDSVATNGEHYRHHGQEYLWEVIYILIYPGNFQLFPHKSPFTHIKTDLQLFWFRKVKVYIALSTKMGDKSQVELIPYLMKEPLKLLQV